MPNKSLRSMSDDNLDAWIEPYRKFWSERLGALEQHLDESYKETPT